MRTSRALALGLTVFAAGCGGGVSQEEFVADATDVCRDYAAAVREDPLPLVLENYGAYIEEVRPVARRARRDLAELERPEDVEADVDRLLENWDEILRGTTQLRDQAAAKDYLGALGTLRQLEESELQADAAARAAGIPACAGFNPFTR